METAAMSIRYQTKSKALSVINAPKMAVNPQMKMVKWSLSKLLFRRNF